MLLEIAAQFRGFDLVDSLERRAERLPEVALMLCLDAGGEDYQRRLRLRDGLRGGIVAPLLKPDDPLADARASQ